MRKDVVHQQGEGQGLRSSTDAEEQQKHDRRYGPDVRTEIFERAEKVFHFKTIVSPGNQGGLIAAVQRERPTNQPMPGPFADLLSRESNRGTPPPANLASTNHGLQQKSAFCNRGVFSGSQNATRDAPEFTVAGQSVHFPAPDAKDGFMHAAQGFLAHKSFERLEAQGEFARASERFVESPRARRRSRFSAAVYSGP